MGSPTPPSLQNCTKLKTTCLLQTVIYCPEGYNLSLKMVIFGFLTIPWLGPKDTEPRVSSVPKAKLGHTEPRALSGYLTPSNGYFGFPYNPLVRPKRHGTGCDIGPKGEARTHGTAWAIGPKGKVRTIHQCSYITLGGSEVLGWIMLILFVYGF